MKLTSATRRVVNYIEQLRNNYCSLKFCNLLTNYCNVKLLFTYLYGSVFYRLSKTVYKQGIVVQVFTQSHDLTIEYSTGR